MPDVLAAAAPTPTPARALPRRRPTDRPGWLAGLLAAAALVAVGLIRHHNYWSGGLDLGVFDQGVWLLSRGLAPEVTVNGRNLFADHLSPVLFLFVPLYRLVATPAWLIGAQGLALGLTVLPLRSLARHEGAPPWVATLLVVGSAPLASAAMFDFHPATLAVPFVAWCLLEARRGDPNRTLLAALGVVACRAELAWMLVGVALVGAPVVRRRLLVLAPLGLGAGFVVPALLGAQGTFAVHYGQLGHSAVDAALHPWRVVMSLLSIDSLTKAVLWLLPVGFLPLRRPRWALALFVASLPVLLSRWAGTSMPWFHYAAPLAPFAAGGALVALADPDRPGWLDARILVGATALALAVMSPLAPNAPASLRLWNVVHPKAGVDLAGAVADVPPGAPVAATNRAVAHLTYRREVWVFPSPFTAGEVPELYAAPDPAAADRIRRVVVISDADIVQARRLGFDGRRTGGVLVGRR